MKIPLFAKIASLATGITALAVLGISTVTAAAPGQIEGGDIYRIANLTQGTGFADPASAVACDQLEYKVRLYNPGPSAIHNVMVRGSITNNAVAQNISTITASASDANPAATNDTATLNLSSAQKLSYTAGSTQLLDQQGNAVRGLPDGVLTGSGIPIGDLGDSQIEFVQFKVSVACPTPPPPPSPVFTCDKLDAVVGDNRTVKITAFDTTATNGAVFKNAVVDWGDSSAPLTSDSPVGQTHQYANDGTFTIAATAHFTVNGQDKTADGPNCTKTVKIATTPPPPPPPSPVFSCDKLDVATEGDRTVKISAFDTTAKDGATFKDAVVDWGDSSPALTSDNPVGQTHQYAKDGTFTIAAIAHFTVDGQDKTADGPNCMKTVKIETPPAAPVFSCDKLTVEAGDNRTVKITAFDTTAKNGATFKDAVVDWGDASNPLTTSKPVGETHQYSKDGSFTVVATAHFTVDGKDVTANGPQCAQKVTFTPGKPPVVTPTPTTPPSTTTTTTTATPGSTETVTTASAPAELVNTGPGELVGLFVGTSIAGTFVYRYVLSRRLSRD